MLSGSIYLQPPELPPPYLALLPLSVPLSFSGDNCMLCKKLTKRAGIEEPSVKIAGPLTYSESGANLPFTFELKNVGNAPVLFGTFHAWLEPFYYRSNIVAIQKRRCDNIKDQPVKNEFTIFPDKTYPSGGVSVAYSAIMPPDVIRAAQKATGKNVITMQVIGCVDYTFTADLRHHHQTRFTFTVLRRAPFPIFFTPGEAIPQEDLSFSWPEDISAD